MVTAIADHGVTDLDNELIMPLPIFRTAFFAIAFGMAAPLFAQQAATAESEAGRRPLNLSLPRDAVFPPGTLSRQEPTPQAGMQSAPNRATEAPYGTGFEARRRGLGGRGFGGGGGPGGGGFGGGGRGMGRGR